MPKFLYDKFHLSLAMAGLSATIFVQLILTSLPRFSTLSGRKFVARLQAS
jgi:hypothetical protein